MSSDIRNIIQVQLQTDSATAPSRGIVDSIGLNLFLDTSSVDIAPQETVLLHTGISAKSPAGTYLRIAPRSGLTIKRHLTTLAGVVDPDYTGEIIVVMQNFGLTSQKLHQGDKIAQLIPERASMPAVEIVSKLTFTDRGSLGFGSTDKAPSSTSKVTPLQPFSVHPPVAPSAAAAACLSAPDSLQISAQDIHCIFGMPYDISMSPSPFDHQTHRVVQIFGNDPLLGFDLSMCDKFGLPKLDQCKRSTPCARLPRWRSELRGAYCTSVNDIPVSTIDEIRSAIAAARLRSDSDVNM